MSELNAHGAHAQTRRGWLLLPLFLLLAVVAAYWGISHIEKQVLRAAPSMLSAAGIDPAGLDFDAEYRNVTVSGLLPEGVSAAQVRRVLEQGRGSGGEDIRNAVVVAGEWVATKPSDTTVSAIADNASDSTDVNDATVTVESTAGSEVVDADSAVEQSRAGIGGNPRINILLAGNELMLSGSDVSKGQVELLLQAANSAVGTTNVKQQWQAEQLPEVSATDAQADDTARVQVLSGLVAELGEHATAASITLENQVIHGSIEARSERSKDTLKTYAGDGVVITTAVFSDAVSIADNADNAERPEQLVASPPADRVISDEPVFAQRQPAPEEAPQQELSSGDASLATDNSPVTDNSLAADTSQTDTVPTDDALNVNATSDDTGADTAASAADEPLGKTETETPEDSVKASDDTAASADNDDDASSVPVQNKADADEEETRLLQEITALQVEIDALQKLIDDDVFFVHDSSAITREALPVLDRVGSAIKRYRRPGVVIEGHTDSLASRSYNLKLSKRRAASVLRYLTRQGVDEKRLRSEGYGEDRPISSNRSKQGRRLNRRVEFIARRPFAEGE